MIFQKVALISLWTSFLLCVQALDLYKNGSASWIGTYKVLSEDSSCGTFLCGCCPNGESQVKIDKNTATRERTSFIIRGESIGIFCKYPMLSDFDLPMDNSNEIKTKLFDRDYRISRENKRISFKGVNSARCDFIIDRIKEESGVYDAIVEIDSIFALEKNGWPVWIKDKNDFNIKKKKDTIIVGVAGLYNKGKTWLINQLAESNFSSGFHVHTVGLSIKYSDYETKVASYLDTAGFETPVKYYDTEAQSNHHQSFGEESEEKVLNYTSMTELVEGHKLKIKDRHITEDLLQNFILEKANIIIIVVGQLTFSDQKLINRILSNYGPTGREMFVVHNFFELHEIRHVLENIESDIFGSYELKTSVLEINRELTKSEYYHQEVYINKAFPNVRHLVTARDGTPAGDYFNKPVINFIRSLIQSKTPMEPFDILHVLKSYVQSNIPKYLDLRGNEEYELVIEEIEGEKRMKCKVPFTFKLNPISFDVNGALLRQGLLESTTDYDMILSENHLIFTVDVPGIKKDAATGKRKINYKWERSDKTCFVFEAELEEGAALKPTDLTVVKNRKRGYIKITPPCLDPNFEVNNKYADIKLEEGVLTIVFPVVRKRDVEYSVEL